MADSTHELSFRLASHGDYDAVMRISEGIYGDRDYLPAYFHSYIDDPEVTVFLAMVGEQVVGLRASRIMEGGTAFITKAARVAPDWRGQGIDRQLSVHQDTWVRQNCPAVKYKRSVTYSGSPMSESMKRNMNYLFNLPFIGYECGPGLWWRQDPAQLDTTGLPDVVPLQDADDDFCAAVQKWLPAGACGGHDSKPIILVDWDPYTLSPANLKRLQAQNTIYMLNHEEETSLSLSNTYLSPTVRLLCVQVYSKDFPTVLKHLLRHLQDASRTYRSDVVCLGVFVSQYELKDAVHDICRETLQMEQVHPSEAQALVFESEIGYVTS